MQHINITHMSTGGLGGSTVVVAHLDHEPTSDWLETFDRSTRPAVFGQTPHLEGDRITVIAPMSEQGAAQFAAQEAVLLTNALLRDRESRLWR
jgi:hypothetical protein